MVHRLVGAHRIRRAFTRRATRREKLSHSLSDEDHLKGACSGKEIAYNKKDPETR